MGILKSVFKVLPLPPPLPLIQCCELITLLNASFAHCFSILLRERRGEKRQIVQIAVFPIILSLIIKEKITIASLKKLVKIKF